LAKTSSRRQTSGNRRNWTVMVYMAAGDSHKLDTVAVRDLKEMELGTKGNDNVAVVAQINRHWPKGAQRYEITSKGTKLLRSLNGETNMGNGKTLSKFLTDVVKDERYRASHYCLVLWGHAFGVGFGRDEQDALLLPELREAIAAFNKARSTKTGQPNATLEILGANACTMSYLEAAFELREVASLMVASQITVPFVGWPYGVVLSRIGGINRPDEVAKVIVDAYTTQFDDLPGGDRLAMTVLDLNQADKCGRRLETLATAIHEEISYGSFNTETMAELRDIFMGAAAGDVRPLIDLTALCEILGGKGTSKMARPIEDAARSLLAGLRQPPDRNLIEEDDDAVPTGEDTLILYKRAHPQLVDLKGIGIYAPFITDQGILDRLELSAPLPNGGPGSLKRGQKDYEELALFNSREGERGAWPTLVYDDLKRTIPAELMVEIDGIGALQTGDRADVAQIIMSIESVLNGVDRSIARAKRDIVKAIVRDLSEPKLDTMVSPSSLEGVVTRPVVTPKTTFGPPWLRLIQPLGIETLREVDELKKRLPATTTLSYGSGPNGERLDVVDEAVERFKTIERAIGATEQVILRALTHVRFGLGPYSPNKLLVGDVNGMGNGETKPGTGNGETKPGTGNGETKPGTGDVGTLLRPRSSSGDLRADLALLRVADLFKQVGEALITLEAAATSVEAAARAMLIVSPVLTPDPRDAQKATAKEIDQSFRVVEEASSETRRTVRRILAHPVYGLGPGEEPLSLDIREDLALFGGLSRRHLKLL
jgi:hypothetical protein